MNSEDADFLERLLATFRIEADEHLSAISSGLIELENAHTEDARKKLIEGLFREIHSLKGAARSVNLKSIESLCHAMEDVFSRLKKGRLFFSPDLGNLLNDATDFVRKLVPCLEDGLAAKLRKQVRDFCKSLAKASGGDSKQSPITGIELIPGENDKPGKTEFIQPQPVIKFSSSKPDDSEPVSEPPESLNPEVESGTNEPPAHDWRNPSDTSSIRITPATTVRVSTSKLDPLLFQAEEMIQVKLTMAQRVQELCRLRATLDDWRKEETKLPFRRSKGPDRQGLRNGQSAPGWRIPNGPVRHFGEWKSLFERRFNEVRAQVDDLIRCFEGDHRILRRMVDEHVETMKDILMLPLSTMTEGFPKLVRDLARDQGKFVDFSVAGADIEIDKRVLEEIREPLIHLLRNCVDHGIQKPETRVKQEKPETGAITLTFAAKGSRQLEIRIGDDGAGIDTAAVLAAARKGGFVSPEEEKNWSTRNTALGEATGQGEEQEILDMIFRSGISTSPMVTDVSGRGLGLSIVRDRVEKIGGSVSIDSRRGAGTTILLVLPLAMTAFRGVLVSAGDARFLLPTRNVRRTLRVDPAEVKTVENRETILVDGKILPVVDFAGVLGLPPTRENSERGNHPAERIPGWDKTTHDRERLALVVIEQADRRMAFRVEAVLEEGQYLVKDLGRQLRRVRNFSGATVLGTGVVVPVINIGDLMKAALRPEILGARRESSVPGESGQVKRLLVADDSITARTLLKSILESAGYQVATAIDGYDAFLQMKKGGFDLVVSDVDMPRLSGFDLVAKIRGEQALAETPVVLVTALDSREDRERGMEVGADAYIVKRSFDQGNLLDVIKKLVS